MFGRVITAAGIAASLLLSTATVQAEENEFAAPIKEFVTSKVMPWLSSPEVIEAIKAQNSKTASWSAEDITKMDKQWRAEVDASSKPLIDSVLKNKLSAFLSKKKDEAQGLVTEMFVMDAKGLNVGQSDVTSDYWQGDEAKWKKTYKVGPTAMFIDKVEKDESTQTFQSQVSVSIKDESGKAIGAITLGINVDSLQ